MYIYIYTCYNGESNEKKTYKIPEKDTKELQKYCIVFTNPRLNTVGISRARGTSRK